MRSINAVYVVVDLRQLRYFQAIAHAGRISEAARTLGVSQPALSIAMKKLEEDVGAALFERDHAGAHLTASGRELLVVVGQAIALLEEGRARIAGLQSEPVGRFAIGCPHALGAYFLPGFLGAFAAAHPRIELAIQSRPSRQIETAVAARELQLGIVTHVPEHPDLVRTELFHDTVALVSINVPPTWQAAVAKLRAGPLLLVGHVPQAAEIVEQLRTRGLVPTRLIECGDIQLVKELALAGSGVAILPLRVAAHGFPGVLRPLHVRLPSVADTIRLIYRGDLQRTHASTLLREALVEHGRALVP